MLEFRKSGCIHHEFPILLFPRPKKKKGRDGKAAIRESFLISNPGGGGGGSSGAWINSWN